VQSVTEGDVIAFREVGGLHHRYERRAAWCDVVGSPCTSTCSCGVERTPRRNGRPARHREHRGDQLPRSSRLWRTRAAATVLAKDRA